MIVTQHEQGIWDVEHDVLKRATIVEFDSGVIYVTYPEKNGVQSWSFSDMEHALHFLTRVEEGLIRV